MSEKTETFQRVLELLPCDIVSSISTSMAQGGLNQTQLETAFASVDWKLHRNLLEQILLEFLPIEQLVPEIYEKWRPVFRDGFAFIGARLSSPRLTPKLAEQIAFPDTISLEDRILAFIRRIPIFQKIGQTLARDTSLDPGLRTRLMTLEDGIHEIAEKEVRIEINRQLGEKLEEYQIRIDDGVYGEGSVSALLRFSYATTTGAGSATGVFKVLKPFIPKYLDEDLTLLTELADYFDENQARYQLGDLNLRAILNDVRDLYKREIDFVNERENMAAAAWRYTGVKGIRIPQPVAALSTETITAMSEERGVKITDAFLGNAEQRGRISRRLIECLVARPLFAKQEISLFHVDPHVGNLRVDEATEDIILLDWALTGTLTTAERRSLILLFIALPLRDEGQILEALAKLSLTKDKEARNFLKRNIETFIDALPGGIIPNADCLSDLLNDLLRAGARFSGSFLIFRKMLLTLEDVIGQISPGQQILPVVLEYALATGFLNNWNREARGSGFRIPLRGSDVFGLGLSLQSFLPRVWLQSLRRNARYNTPVTGNAKSFDQVK